MHRDGGGVRASLPPRPLPGGEPAKLSDAGQESPLTCIFIAKLAYSPGPRDELQHGSPGGVK